MIDKKRCPGHPGHILKNLYMTPLQLSVTQLASRLGVSRKAISLICNGHKAITPEMALRLSRAFPNSTAESWLTMQRNFDLWQAEHKKSAWAKVKPIIQAEAV